MAVEKLSPTLAQEETKARKLLIPRPPNTGKVTEITLLVPFSTATHDFSNLIRECGPPASKFPELAIIMKRCAFALALALLLGACGGNPATTPNNPESVIDGTWTVVLSGAQQIYTPTAITFTLTSTSNNGLSVTNLPASALGYCFFGAYGSSATFNDQTGGFQLRLGTTQRGGTLLQLNGMLTNNTITGSWTMTSTYIACNEPGGTFTMTKR